MGCRYLIFELDNVQHLLQYCLGHRVCMVMFIPTVPLTDWSELRQRVSVWRELELSYGLRAEQRFPSISKGKVGTCQNHCPIVAIVCSLESSAFLSLSAFIFWGSDQHRRAFAALSLHYLDLFGLYRRGDASQAKLRHKVSQRVTSPIFCSVFVNSLDMLTHWQIQSQVVPQKTIH